MESSPNVSEFAFQLSARIIQDWASRTRLALGAGVMRGCAIGLGVVRGRRVQYLVTGGHRKAGKKLDTSPSGDGSNDEPFLPTDLTSCTSLGADFRTEGMDLLDDQALHALNRVLFLEAEVKGLNLGAEFSIRCRGRGMTRTLTEAHTGSSAGSCQTAR